jgi:hypothetical protein
MRFDRQWAAAIAVAGVVISVAPAHASVVTETYTFGIGPFTGGVGLDTCPGGGTSCQAVETPPYSYWSGSFTVTFDPTTTTSTIATVASFTSNLGFLGTTASPVASRQWEFGTFIQNGQYMLEVANNCSNNNCILQDGNSVFQQDTGIIVLDLGPSTAPLSSYPTFTSAEYTTTDQNNALSEEYGAPHFSGEVGTVPEPASLAMLATGIVALVGLRSWRFGSVRSRARKAA